MPYIPESRRFEVDAFIPTAGIAGELNYQLTRVVQKYVKDHGASYRVFNDVIGALECAKLELYRRLVAPYEDTKRAQNGDVY
jgi:hypothetical protein